MLAVERRPYPSSAPHLRCPRPGPGAPLPRCPKDCVREVRVVGGGNPLRPFLHQRLPQGSPKVEGAAPLKVIRARCIEE